ncbi:MAG: hypothetical protein KFH98_04875 [Gemmatimonadetes bacterium]|nr:hypothetical protein [Gemmatimonadota bacterium]
MRNSEHSKAMAVLAGIVIICACDTAQDTTERHTEPSEATVDPVAEREATARMESELATVEQQLDSLPGLILSVRRTLRRHLNEEHIARARALGVPPVADTATIARHVSAGSLVRLPDSTRHWVVRELDQSLPYVTPDKLAALEELGDRFHERLNDAGLPPFRFEISSALRTGALQQELRARNRNASQTESSHEFGTTIDIAYNEFAPPSFESWAPWRSAVTGDGDADQRLRARIDAIAAMRLDSLGNTYSDHLKGELGAVLKVMQDEGRLWPLYERSQPVFHTTLASPKPAANSDARTAP